MEVMLAKMFSIVWLTLAAVLFVLLVIVSAMSQDDDDPDDDDLFLSRAYSMFSCNIWHDTDYPEPEYEEDG